MEFFNRIEDVIEFKLTQYGKKKFTEGLFSPKYYAFSDSDILYDSRYAGFTGTQNEPFDEATGSIRPRHATSFSTILDNDKIFKNRVMAPCVLGTSEWGSDKFPALDIKLYNGNFTGTSYFITSSAYLDGRIPVVNVNVDCLFNMASKDFDSHKYILLEINEINGLFEKENFEFEILKVKNSTQNNFINANLNFEIPLEFDNSNISSNNFSGSFDSQYFEDEELTSDMVNYWFEIYIDEQIPEILEFDNSNANIYLDPRNNVTANC